MADGILFSGDFAAWRDWPRHWMAAFIDHDGGGAHERLDAQRRTLGLDKRLVTQCRQAIVYARASEGGRHPDFLQAARHVYEFITAHYPGGIEGSYHFSVRPGGARGDTRLDLYGTAFFLLASAAYYRAGGDGAVLARAARTLDFIDAHFRHDSGAGFYEALTGDGRPVRELRRQNPHMHLFEACLYMYEASGDMRYRRMADELFGLFTGHFYNAAQGVVIEFFDESLRPHPEKGTHVEAGHIAEWIWLIERYKEACGIADAALDAMQAGLFGWFAVHGLDPHAGGILNAQLPDGTPLDTDKRIWPLFETLRAAAIMRRIPAFRAQAGAILGAVQGIATGHYLRPDGWWTEIHSRAFQPATDYLPGTTPYHLYPVLIEADAYLCTGS